MDTVARLVPDDHPGILPAYRDVKPRRCRRPGLPHRRAAPSRRPTRAALLTYPVSNLAFTFS
jgi:hypothetical protein